MAEAESPVLRWRAMAKASPPPDPQAPPEFRTASGLARRRFYGPADLPDPAAIGEPGSYPYTRGLHPDGYRGRLWTMRQYAGFGGAAESNRRYRYLLDRGTTGLSLALRPPAQDGQASHHPHPGRAGGPRRGPP